MTEQIDKLKERIERARQASELREDGFVHWPETGVRDILTPEPEGVAQREDRLAIMEALVELLAGKGGKGDR